MQPTPTLDEWLSLPQADLAAQVQDRDLTVMLSVDGTRRHHLLSLLNRGEAEPQIADFTDYAAHSSQAYTRVYSLLYSLGVKAILTSMLYPPNFVRSERFLGAAMAVSEQFLCHQPFTDLYARWNVRARLYGDYDFAPNAAPVRDRLNQLAARLAEMTPEGERLLLAGYNAGTFAGEMLARAGVLQAHIRRPPTETEVRAACFPDGPGQINIYIGAGWLRPGSTLPCVLDGGKTDLYFLRHLALDLDEVTVRRILYDHLFLRRAAPEDDAPYTTDDLKALRDYYHTHQGRVVGVGELVGPGLWYADFSGG